MDDDPVLKVPSDRPRQHRSLDITPFAFHLADHVAVADPNDTLFDDRTRIQFRSGIVSGCTYQLHTLGMRLVIGSTACKCGQE